jgi:hypothetical protein
MNTIDAIKQLRSHYYAITERGRDFIASYEDIYTDIDKFLIALDGYITIIAARQFMYDTDREDMAHIYCIVDILELVYM